jgi:hypothetical protein
MLVDGVDRSQSPPTIPIGSTITIHFTIVYDEDPKTNPITNYKPFLHYKNTDNSGLDHFETNFNLNDLISGQYSFTVPQSTGYSPSETKQLFIDLLPLNPQTNTTIYSRPSDPFSVDSVCNINPNYCGSHPDSQCDIEKSQCSKCGGGYTGSRCEIPPCQSLNCVTQNLITNPQCDDNAPKCQCKDGFSGQRCEISNSCQVIDCHGGFIPYEENMLTISCQNHCTCPNGFVDADNYVKVGGCTKCGIVCQNGGVLKSCEEGCRCVVGFMGEDCSIGYSVGTLSFTNLEGKIAGDTDPADSTNVLAKSRAKFIENVIQIVAQISTLSTKEVQFDTSFFGPINGSNQSYFNILIKFPYSYTALSDGSTSIPRLFAIQQGWDRIFNDLFILDQNNQPIPSKYSTLRKYVLFINPYTTSQAQNINYFDPLQTIEEKPSDVIIATALWDVGCKKLFKNHEEQNAFCSSGVWPYNTIEPNINDKKGIKDVWVIIIAVIFGVIAIALIIGFVVLGVCFEAFCFNKNEPPSMAEKTNQNKIESVRLEKVDTQQSNGKDINNVGPTPDIENNIDNDTSTMTNPDQDPEAFATAKDEPMSAPDQYESLEATASHGKETESSDNEDTTT